MLLKKYGESITIEGKVFKVGGNVYANECSGEYEGLIGYIDEIRTDKDKETENEGIDIIIEFETPTDESIIKNLTELYQVDSIEKVALDYVVMSADMLGILD